MSGWDHPDWDLTIMNLLQITRRLYLMLTFSYYMIYYFQYFIRKRVSIWLITLFWKPKIRKKKKLKNSLSCPNLILYASDKVLAFDYKCDSTIFFVINLYEMFLIQTRSNVESRKLRNTLSTVSTLVAYIFIFDFFSFLFLLCVIRKTFFLFGVIRITHY